MNRNEEAGIKIERVRAWLAGSGLGGVLLESRANFAWITAGGHSHVSTSEEKGAAAVLITSDRCAVVTTNIEGRRLAAEELPPGNFEIAEYPWQSPDQLDLVVERVAGSGGLGGDLPGGNRVPLDEKFVELRRVMLPAEIERYRELAQDAAFAVESACRAVAPRDSELQVAARVAARCYEKKILPAVNLVAADERVGKYRHPVPTANRVDSTMLVALTAQRGGLHISLTRTVCFGEPEPDQVHRHAACARVDARMILASRPGATLGEIVAAGVKQYGDEGFPDEWRHHHQGGLTGYSGREIFATPTTEYTLQANQALTWNPSITGAKSEDTILVTDNRAEVLTSTGHWPTLEIDVGGRTMLRPGLLIR